MSLLNVKKITNGVDTASTKQIARGSSRAKANFSHVGTVRDDLNVSSITDAGESLYRVNFAEQLNTANYCVSIVANSEGIRSKGGMFFQKRWLPQERGPGRVWFRRFGYA